MSVFYYIEELENLEGNSIKISVPEKIDEKTDIFAFFTRELQFPDYFGWNWDAFFECMITLPQVKAKKIIIAHKDIPFELNEDQRKIYIFLLKQVVLTWMEYGEKEIFVLFPERYRQIVSEIECNMKYIM